MYRAFPGSDYYEGSVTVGVSPRRPSRVPFDSGVLALLVSIDSPVKEVAMDECSSIWVALIDGATTALVVLAALAFAYIYYVKRRDTPRQRDESDRGQNSGD